MKIHNYFCLAATCLFLMGCDTAYQPAGVGGGYSETIYAPDSFYVHFDGNEHTSSERSSDFALLRAADLTIEHGYRYFVFSNITRPVVNPAPPIPPSTTEINNNVYGNTYNYNTGMQWNNDNAIAAHNSQAGLANLANYIAAQQQLRQFAQTEIMVHCFLQKPSESGALDAHFLASSLRQKYGIKSPVPASPAMTMPPIPNSQKNPLSGHYVGSGKSVNKGLEQTYQIALDISESGEISFTCTGVVNSQQIVVTGRGMVDARGNVTVQNQYGDTGHGTIVGNVLNAGGENADGSIKSNFTAQKQD